ncbi:NifB/NifX family molybdenum-iron cluster-binding protein [Shewanella sp.]|uniref:NifB/NifX family molybdenum-iron cluster-binding protein n=1 Tax=Shewanella sp. TaxID=50422 RepID=UPI003A979B2C
MITAIPMTGDKIANHFSKADSFLFIDEHGATLAESDNPALAQGCAAKANIIKLLQQQQAQRVVVRNIGERLLARLIQSKFAVFQIGSSRWDSQQFLADAPRYLLPLTSADQGRPSVNFQHKHAAGTCGCEHGGEQGCCKQQQGDGQPAAGHNCQHHREHGHCCHQH